MVIRDKDDEKEEEYVDSSIPSEEADEGDTTNKDNYNNDNYNNDYSRDDSSYDNYDDNFEDSGSQSTTDKIVNFIKENKLLVIALVSIIVLLIGLSACSNSKGSSTTGTVFVVENNNIQVQKGTSKKIVTSIAGTNSNKWAYESQNPSVAIVDSQGNITGIELGNATIVVTYIDINQKVYTAPCYVEVIKKEKGNVVEFADFEAESIEMPLNFEYTLVKEFTPEDATIEKLEFTSSNTSVATVDNNGKVKSLSEGTTEIKMTVNDALTASIKVTVKKDLTGVVVLKHLTSFKFSEEEYKVQIGKTITLSLDTNPVQADTSSLKWTSSNSNVTTVSNGVVVGISEGTAEISASYNDITEKTKVVVTKDSVAGDVTGISVEQQSVSLKVGESYDIKVSLTPAGSEAQIQFNPSNSAVANVTSDGRVTAYCAGESDITIMLTNNPAIYTVVKVTVTGDGTYIDQTPSDPGGTSSSSGGGGGGTSDSSCSSFEFTIKSNTPSAVSRTNGGNSVIYTGSTLEIYFDDVISATACGAFKSAKINYNKYGNTTTNLYETLKQNSKTISITLPVESAKNVLYMKVTVEYENATKTKEYWTKYKVDRSPSSSSSPLSIEVAKGTASKNSTYGGDTFIVTSTTYFNRVSICTSGTTSDCQPKKDSGNDFTNLQTTTISGVSYNIIDTKSSANYYRRYSNGVKNVSFKVANADASNKKICFQAYSGTSYSNRECRYTTPKSSTSSTTQNYFDVSFSYKGKDKINCKYTTYSFPGRNVDKIYLKVSSSAITPTTSNTKSLGAVRTVPEANANSQIAKGLSYYYVTDNANYVLTNSSITLINCNAAKKANFIAVYKDGNKSTLFSKTLY